MFYTLKSKEGYLKCIGDRLGKSLRLDKVKVTTQIPFCTLAGVGYRLVNNEHSQHIEMVFGQQDNNDGFHHWEIVP